MTSQGARRHAAATSRQRRRSAKGRPTKGTEYRWEPTHGAPEAFGGRVVFHRFSRRKRSLPYQWDETGNTRSIGGELVEDTCRSVWSSLWRRGGGRR